MFANLIDRTLSETILYGIFITAIWSTRSLLNPLLASSLFLISTVIYIQLLIRAIRFERRCDQLGARAPSIRTWTPFNVGFLFQALYCFSTQQNDRIWWENFAKLKRNRSNPWTMETVCLGERFLLTADEENIKAVLATQFADYGKGPQFRKEWKDFLGLSIFTTDGEMWHKSRSLLRPQFIRDRVSDLHIFEHHVQVLLPLLKEFLLGQSVDSLRHSQTDFAEAFTEVQRVQGTVARAGMLQALIPKKSFYRSLEVLNAFVRQYIDRALQMTPEELEKTAKSDEEYTFLHALASYTRDPEVLRDQIVAVLLAGRDTTASTLTWLFYELSRHPAIVEKLHEEIERSVGLERQPTYADLKSMRYLQRTINETLRLYPIVPYNVRVALQDTTLPRGGGVDGSEPIAILEGTAVSYASFILQRRETIYPPVSSSFPHHLEFAPERWSGWTPRPWTYIPFNGGPRICIGQPFALTEMSYTIVRILQTFRRVECRQTDFPGFKSDIVLQPAKGVKLALLK